MMEQRIIKTEMIIEPKHYNWVDIVFEMINENKTIKENGKRISAKSRR